MDSSSDRRRKRSAGNWRCSDAAAVAAALQVPGESYCAKPSLQRKIHSQNLGINKNEREEMKKYGNSRSWKRKNAATISSGSKREASDSEFNRKLVRTREMRLSASSKRKKVIDGKSENDSLNSVLKVNSGEERDRRSTSPGKSSIDTVGVTEILLNMIHYFYGFYGLYPSMSKILYETGGFS